MAAGPSDGPLVVLLHGFPEFWYGWRRQLGPLAASGLRVVAPDLRGYNQSSKPSALPPTSWMSWPTTSWASPTPWAAAGSPSSATTGAACSPGTWPRATRAASSARRSSTRPTPPPCATSPASHPSQLARSWYVAFFQLPGLPERVLRAGGFAWLANGLTGSSRPGTFGDADLAQYRRAWSQPGALTAMLAWYRAVRLQQPPTTPLRVEVPVQVIWGDRDRFLDRRLAQAGIAACERGEAHHLRQASHWVQHEEPDEVNRLLLRFLA